MNMSNTQSLRWSYYLLALLMLGLDSKLAGEAFQPEFAEPIGNLTVPIGRDATFRCLVQNLGGYRVGWVKADTKAIQAIHVHVITNNHRVAVSHTGQTEWNLHIRSVQEDDRGQYMCQINTDPMQSQMGYLDVVVPPDFIEEETSGDVMVPEGGTVKLSCRARGKPIPRVTWRKEDGSDIVIRNLNGTKSKVLVYEDEVLSLNKISRSDMGAYLCIASNGIPPSVSKRIVVRVHFHPVIQVPNQLYGAPLGTDVTLECYVEASPRSINYWVRESNEMVISSLKYEVVNTMLSLYESRMSLLVRRLTDADLGGYRCVAKNSLGEVDGSIRIYGITRELIKNTSPSSKNEEFSSPMEGPDNQFGSAERSDDEDDKELVTEFSDVIQVTTYSIFAKNKTFYATNNLEKQNINNKVRKVIGNLEQEPTNSASNWHSNKIYFSFILSLFLVIFRTYRYIPVPTSSNTNIYINNLT